MKKDELVAANPNQSEISKFRKKIRRNEHFRQEAEKLNQSAINRELGKLF